MNLNTATQKIDEKQRQLIIAKSNLLFEVKILSNIILNKRIYDRKWKKCLMYCLDKKLGKYLTKTDIATIFKVHPPAASTACVDVDRWLWINEDDIIRGYVDEIMGMIEI